MADKSGEHEICVLRTHGLHLSVILPYAFAPRHSRDAQPRVRRNLGASRSGVPTGDPSYFDEGGSVAPATTAKRADDSGVASQGNWNSAVPPEGP